VRTNGGDRNAKATWAKANEIVLNVFTVTEGYDVDDHDLTSQIRKTLMTGPKGNIFQAGDLHFLVCPDCQSPEFQFHNLPDKIFNLVRLQFSEVANLMEGLTLGEVLHALVETCLDMHRISMLYITRHAEYDIKTGAIMAQGQKRDALIVGWAGEPGEVGRSAMRLLCAGETGRHLPIIGNIPGAAKHKALDSLMRMIVAQAGLDGRPGKVKYQARSIRAAAPTAVPTCAPRRRESGVTLMTGPRLSGYESEAADSYGSASPSTPAPRRREQSRETHTPFTTPSSRSMFAQSTALNLSTGDRSLSSSSSGLKTAGSELTSNSLEQVRDYVRMAMEAERERSLARDEERDRKEREREAERDRKACEREIAQEAKLGTAIQATVHQTISFAFGTPDFANMLVTAARAVAMAQPLAPPSPDRLPLQNDGLGHPSAESPNHV
jgi:hypothetical protein